MGNDQTMGVAILNNTNFKITCGASMGATLKYANDIMPGEIWYRHIGAVWVTLFAMPTTDKTRYQDVRCTKEIAQAIGTGVPIYGLLPSLDSVIDFYTMMLLCGVDGVCGLKAAVAQKRISIAQIVAGVEGAGVQTLTAAIAAVSGFRVPQVLAAVQATGIVAVAVAAGATTYKTNEKVLDEACEHLIEIGQNKAQLYAEQKGCQGGAAGTWLVLSQNPSDGSFILTSKTAEFIWERGQFDKYSSTCYYTKEGLPEPPKNTKGMKFDFIKW